MYFTGLSVSQEKEWGTPASRAQADSRNIEMIAKKTD
jgi:hypothetical protein